MLKSVQRLDEIYQPSKQSKREAILTTLDLPKEQLKTNSEKSVNPQNKAHSL